MAKKCFFSIALLLCNHFLFAQIRLPHLVNQVAVDGGIWIPTKGARVLGNHPQFGVKLGKHWRLGHVDLVGEYRFLKAPNAYTFRYMDSLMNGSYYRGCGAGLEVGIDLDWPYYGLFFAANLRLGYDRIDFHRPAGKGFKKAWNKEGAVYAPLLGMELVGRRYLGSVSGFNTRHLLGLFFRYNVVNYNRGSKLDFKGHTINAGLRWKVSRDAKRSSTIILP